MDRATLLFDVLHSRGPSEPPTERRSWTEGGRLEGHRHSRNFPPMELATGRSGKPAFSEESDAPAFLLLKNIALVVDSSGGGGGEERGS